MVMDTIQIRLSKGQITKLDDLVKTGMYSSRADVIRDSVRRLIIDRSTAAMVGIAPNTGDSVKEVRELRKKLSKEKFDLDEINSYSIHPRVEKH